MTDNEIIKALECCKCDDCDNCPNDFGNCYANLAGYALDFINRQKAEIERVTVNMNAFGLGMKREKERADTAKAEAIKEFAERVKGMHRHNTTSVVSLVTVFDNINTLVKEMVGDNNG